MSMMIMPGPIGSKSAHVHTELDECRARAAATASGDFESEECYDPFLLEKESTCWMACCSPMASTGCAVVTQEVVLPTG